MIQAASEPVDAPAPPVRLAETDAQMPRHWRSGSLKYTGFEKLAEGGVAEVSRCTDQNLRRQVAYKRLHPHLCEDDVETRRFLREARVTAMIPHPGTVPIYELGRDRDGFLFFSMKLLGGRDMRQVLSGLMAGDAETAERFPLPRLIDILIQCCHTVAYAHQQGIIHRDIKPANIQVGQFGEVTVLDWGLAKVRDEPDLPVDELPSVRDAIDRELARPGSRCGTPLYMSPEQAQGQSELDERTDVYNLGIVLFEMLTHKPLVQGQELEEVLAQVIMRPTPRPTDVAAERRIPIELEQICLKALAKQPEDRYPSVQAMTADLMAYRQRGAVSVCRYSPLQRIVRWRKRHTVAFASTACLAVGLGAGFALAMQLLAG